MMLLQVQREEPLQVLLDVYTDRKDLQIAYPEASTGDYRRLITWACGVSDGSWADTAFAALSPYTRWYRDNAPTSSKVLAHLRRGTLSFAHYVRKPWIKTAARCVSMPKASHRDLDANNGGARTSISAADFADAKNRKLERIRPLLRADMPHLFENDCIDFLTPELREQFNIVDTSAVSSNDYDEYAAALIEKYRDGLILDCGAGRRSIYFENVVNFEIVAYDTTDVRGVGEVLPFADNSFDAVFSLAVLEHVKDPFACAKEIVRVLKPGGDLMCCVPFLQPLHGYPHHYYNMSGQGLKNLFEPRIAVDRHEVYYSVRPIWSLTWFLNSWAAGLNGQAKEEFLNLRISELLQTGDKYLDRAFVTELSQEKNFELASATVLFGHKRP